MMIKLKRIYEEIFKNTQWMWITPDNKIIDVSSGTHANYLRKNVYKDSYNIHDNDLILKAIKNGYVRAVFVKISDHYYQLTIYGYEIERIKNVIKEIFWDSIKYNNIKIYIEAKNGIQKFFDTRNSKSKIELMDWI